MAVLTAQKLNVAAMLSWGSTEGEEETLLNFAEAAATTGNARGATLLQLAASGTGSYDTAGLCDTATWILVQDLNGTGLNLGFANGVTPCQIAANGIYLFKNRNATPPVLYFQNPDSGNAAAIRIAVLGSYT